MHHVDNQGVRITYRLYGGGEPLVLIHGWSCEGRYWDEFGYTSKLSAEYKVIVPDLRGHGDSETPENEDFTDRAFASDVIAVLDDLAIDSAHVFGYSLGGWVVFELAANCSSRVQSIVIGGAHPYDEDLSPMRGFTSTDLLNSWEEVDAPLSADSKKRIAGLDQRVLIAMVPDRVDKAERLVDLQMPCLTICGTNDWRFEDMKRFAEGNDPCLFVPIEGTDHLQTWLQPASVLPPIQEFLQTVRG